jgi:hypothetical protein
MGSAIFTLASYTDMMPQVFPVPDYHRLTLIKVGLQGDKIITKNHYYCYNYIIQGRVVLVLN